MESKKLRLMNNICTMEYQIAMKMNEVGLYVLLLNNLRYICSVKTKVQINTSIYNIIPLHFNGYIRMIVYP